MRILEKEEVAKRGCVYCTNSKKARTVVRTEKWNYGTYKRACKYDECPYHELDKHETYSKYLDSDDSKFRFHGFKNNGTVYK